MKYDHTLVKRALDQAAFWHRDQIRKYPGVSIPYVSHVAGVGSILSRHRFDYEVVAAGILHDTIEDCGVTAMQLSDMFTPYIANLVVSCSETNKSLSWAERKDAYMNAFPKKQWNAQAIAIADKIDNFASILICNELYGDPWPTFKFGRDVQLELFDRLGLMLKALPSHPIIDEYFVTLESVRNMKPHGQTTSGSDNSALAT